MQNSRNLVANNVRTYFIETMVMLYAKKIREMGSYAKNKGYGNLLTYLYIGITFPD